MELQPTPRWRSSRIELFLLTADAVTQAYVDWLNDVEINRFLEARFARHDLESTRRFVAQVLADPLTVLFGIRSLELRRHVGNIKIGPIDRRHGLGEIGIMIGDRAVWGQGFGSEAIERVADIAANELQLRKLSAGCYGSNAASARAFQKAGFTIEAVRRAHFLLDGRAEDALLMGRLL